MDAYTQKRLLILTLLLGGVIGGMMSLSDKVKRENAAAEDESTAISFTPTPYDYQLREPSTDGTGKIYMGREISQVMGHEGIDWLERSTREQEENPKRAVQGLTLKPDAVVADIGAGSGYYTFRIAPLVPEGKVIGVDVQPEMVAYLYQKSQQLAVTNVEAHLGNVDNIRLPEASLDAAILVDAYHEFSHPNEVMQSVYHAMKPGGRLYLLEYRAEDDSVPIKPQHKMSQAQAIKEMEAVGFRHLRTEDFLPWQHFIVFEK
ncbi:class I SAM-dependent methyltransferase [Verrucomicrobiaceae bacterium R5-34]|nr:class I SAM-dependent methyltransferase [Verrucomicrobiaceae bacterium R5-34]